MKPPINDLFVAKSPVITLTSDLGLTDFYLAAAKGAIMTAIPDSIIVDVSHENPKFDIMSAAFNLRNAYQYFPEGTIHIISVNAIEDEDTPHIVFEHKGHFFIGADNGIFSLIFDDTPEQTFQIGSVNKIQIPTFPLMNAFVYAAALLAKGNKPESMGRPNGGFRKMLMPSASIGENLLRGSVIYVDSYGNLITNISRKLFEEVGKGRSFQIDLRMNKHNVKKIKNTYNESSDGEPMALFNHLELLEISIAKGSATKLLGLKVTDSLRIEFE